MEMAIFNQTTFDFAKFIPWQLSLTPPESQSQRPEQYQ